MYDSKMPTFYGAELTNSAAVSRLCRLWLEEGCQLGRRPGESAQIQVIVPYKLTLRGLQYSQIGAMGYYAQVAAQPLGAWLLVKVNGSSSRRIDVM